MGKITFISGGARSGKSQFAMKSASTAQSVLFIATASAKDCEMRERIRLHRKNRPSDWKTIEEQKNLFSQIKKISEKFDLVIIDCLTIFISNLLLENNTDTHIANEINSMLRMLKKSKFDSIIVSNEVGLGIVPDNPLARKFRDLTGKINQKVAEAADNVYFVVSGLPLKIKPR